MKKYHEKPPTESSEEISDHIENHIGPIKSVFHEVVWESIHLDVNWVASTVHYRFQVLVTIGDERPAHLFCNFGFILMTMILCQNQNSGITQLPSSILLQ